MLLGATFIKNMHLCVEQQLSMSKILSAAIYWIWWMKSEERRNTGNYQFVRASFKETKSCQEKSLFCPKRSATLRLQSSTQRNQKTCGTTIFGQTKPKGRVWPWSTRTPNTQHLVPTVGTVVEGCWGGLVLLWGRLTEAQPTLHTPAAEWLERKESGCCNGPVKVHGVISNIAVHLRLYLKFFEGFDVFVQLFNTSHDCSCLASRMTAHWHTVITGTPE